MFARHQRAPPAASEPRCQFYSQFAPPRELCKVKIKQHQTVNGNNYILKFLSNIVKKLLRSHEVAFQIDHTKVDCKGGMETLFVAFMLHYVWMKEEKEYFFKVIKEKNVITIFVTAAHVLHLHPPHNGVTTGEILQELQLIMRIRLINANCNCPVSKF